MKKLFIGIGIFAAVALLGCLGIYFKMKGDLETGADVIAEHISVEGIDASGLTAEELQVLLEEQLSEYLGGKVFLARENQQAETTLGELGLHMVNADEMIA